jgi:uncharacterized protein with PQ loop repeat
MLTLIAATATLSGLVAATLPAIQITKMLRSRSSGGISIAYIAGGLANNVIWTVYGFALPNLALIVPDVLTVAMNLTMLTVAIRYRPRPAAEEDDELAAELAQLVAEADLERAEARVRVAAQAA